MNKMLLTTLFAAAAHLAPMACAATEYTLPQLPDGVMPNTEVTTNLLLHVKAERVREFGLTLDAGNCISNEANGLPPAPAGSRARIAPKLSKTLAPAFGGAMAKRRGRVD